MKKDMWKNFVEEQGFYAAEAGGAKRQPTRAEVDQDYTWDLTPIFATPEAWEQEFNAVQADCDALAAWEGKLGESAEGLARFLKSYFETYSRIEKLYVYAHLKNDEDTAEAVNQGRHMRIAQMAAEKIASVAFVRPELLALGHEKLGAWVAAEPGLAHYKQFLDDLLRFEPHTLKPGEERLLAMAGPVLGASANTFELLGDADLTFDPAVGSDGESHEVTHSSFGPLLENKDRELRHSAFVSVYKSYKGHKHTFASTLTGNTKLHNFEAQMRGYKTAREAALFENNIPESVFDQLVETVHKNQHLLHDYVALRKERMGLKELYPYDLYTSLVDEIDLKFSIEEAWELVQEALAPLGEFYLSRLRTAFSERWIDWVDNRGKRSGAYSSGVYGTKPYILMSWQGTLDNVFTLIHELGHSMHSYLTWEHQTPPYAEYCIFLAEIASTTNEVLLTQHLLKKYPDPKMQAYILNHYLDGVKGTVFRQTQFAEFEHLIHELDRSGEALLADLLCERYAKLNAEYYGPALDACEEISYEWARIPHFYYNYYVYQYATGFSAATAFATAILSEGQPAVDRYLGFLKSGCSKYPIETLQKAGVNMLSPEPVETTLKTFGEYLERFKAL